MANGSWRYLPFMWPYNGVDLRCLAVPGGERNGMFETSNQRINGTQVDGTKDLVGFYGPSSRIFQSLY